MSKPPLTEPKGRTLLFQSVGIAFCLDINSVAILEVSQRSVDKWLTKDARLSQLGDLVDAKPG